MDDEAPPRILFLDDDPARAARFLACHPDAVWVQTAEECIVRLSEPWSVVQLDHDLGGEVFVDSARADCGMEVVRWLAGEVAGAHLKDALFVVHTHNMNAAGGMLRTLKEAGYETIYRPFGIDLLSWLDEPDPAPAPCPSPTPATSWATRLRDLLAEWRRRWLARPAAGEPPGD